jgi:hypothetical protein
MWVMTPEGFYSAVENVQDRSQVVVRARVKSDLTRLMEFLPPEERTKPITIRNRDYPWRVFMSKVQWKHVLSRLADGVDYPNFKNEVFRVQGPHREAVYHRVWAALLALEPRRRRAA